MPIVVTFDVERPTSLELNRLRGAFERLGWEHLGNTAYRYPCLGDSDAEDWFNGVVPALMLLRSFAQSISATGRRLDQFTIDVQSSTGYRRLMDGTEVGNPPQSGSQLPLNLPSVSGRAFGAQKLRDWLDGIQWPYA